MGFSNPTVIAECLINFMQASFVMVNLGIEFLQTIKVQGFAHGPSLSLLWGSRMSDVALFYHLILLIFIILRLKKCHL